MQRTINNNIISNNITIFSNVNYSNYYLTRICHYINNNILSNIRSVYGYGGIIIMITYNNVLNSNTI